MKKFTQIKESQESQKSFTAKVEFTIITKAVSESEAAKNIQEIVEVAKKTNPYITSFAVNSIVEQEVNFPDFSTMESVNENAMCINNTMKMMDDYLKNTGAKSTDQHYVNLEKILKVFQANTPKAAMKLESKKDVDVEQMTTDLIDVKKEGLDDAIKAVEDLMKEYKDKEGDVHNQQYANLEDMKKTLMGYKKDSK